MVDLSQLALSFLFCKAAMFEVVRKARGADQAASIAYMQVILLHLKLPCQVSQAGGVGYIIPIMQGLKAVRRLQVNQPECNVEKPRPPYAQTRRSPCAIRARSLHTLQCFRPSRVVYLAFGRRARAQTQRAPRPLRHPTGHHESGHDTRNTNYFKIRP